ncbi:MAG TPA: zinc metalloprotease [Marmoricola sp.]|nr:zinc metalloprotease [Marmoricola sp.]
MNRTLTCTIAALTTALSLVGSAHGVPSRHLAETLRAPHAAATSAQDRSCLDPASDAGARSTRANDTRGMSAAQQRAIESRTTRLLAGRTPVRAGAKQRITVPVYVHVMTSKTGAGNVTDARIAQQVVVLNKTYGGQDPDLPGTLDTGIRFQLAGTDRYANSTWHTDGDSTTYRAKTRKGGRNALNIWLVDFDYLGIATFPWDYAGAPTIDGIRVEFKSLPGGSATHYNHGETVTHETGHWLGLYHTFQGGCASPGDEVSDTAAQASPSSGCPTGRDSCTAAGDDPIHNYMDYSYDTCYTEFTPGQLIRMDKMWTAYRAG